MIFNICFLVEETGRQPLKWFTPSEHVPSCPRNRVCSSWTPPPHLHALLSCIMASKNEVADSTDWLNTSLSSFAPVENALRCQVCKDFFDSPMITSCSHTFCSLCIRRCLSADGKCPACRATDQTSKLRRNWAIQEVVDAFQNGRGVALELAKKEHQARDEDENPRKRKRRNPSAGQAHIDTGKRHTRSQAKRSGSTSLTASQEVVILDSEDGEDEYLPDSKEEREVDDGLVACPMCSVRMKEELVFPHLDQCDGKPKPQSKKATPASVLCIPYTTCSRGSHL